MVVPVSEAAGDAAVEFDQSVHGFSSTVVGAAGVEVAQERRFPLFQCPAQSGDLGDRAGAEGGYDLSRVALVCHLTRAALVTQEGE